LAVENPLTDKGKKYASFNKNVANVFKNSNQNISGAGKILGSLNDKDRDKLLMNNNNNEIKTNNYRSVNPNSINAMLNKIKLK